MSLFDGTAAAAKTAFQPGSRDQVTPLVTKEASRFLEAEAEHLAHMAQNTLVQLLKKKSYLHCRLSLRNLFYLIATNLPLAFSHLSPYFYKLSSFTYKFFHHFQLLKQNRVTS